MANRVLRAVEPKKTVASPGTRKKPPEHWRLVARGPCSADEARLVSTAKLSRDIRTQLYIIIGFAELMLEEIPGKINAEQRRNLNDVLNSGKHLLDLIRDIVARAESGK